MPVIFLIIMAMGVNAIHSTVSTNNAPTWITSLNTNSSVNITVTTIVYDTVTNITLLNFSAPANVLIWYGEANNLTGLTCSNGGAGSWVNCTHVGFGNEVIEVNFNISASADGSYTVTTYSADNNSDTNSSTSTIQYDSTEPTSSITDPVSGQNISASSYTISGTASDDTSGVSLVEVSVDGGTTWSAATGTTSWTYAWTPSADGSVTIQARATDAAGLVQSTPSSVPVTVDQTPPQAAVPITPAAGSTVSGSIQINATLSDATSGIQTAYYWIENASGNYTPWTAMTKYLGSINLGNWSAAVFDTSSLNDGVYNITYNYTDYAGNNNITKVQITVDNTAPSVAFYTSPSRIHSLFNFNVSASDGSGLGYVKILNSSGGWSDMTDQGTGYYNYTLDSTLLNSGSDGYYNVTINASDSLGNEGITKLQVYIDNTAPVIVLNQPIDGYNTSSAVVTLNFTVYDDGAAATGENLQNCFLNYSTVSNQTGPIASGTTYTNTSSFADGVYYWNVTCYDNATSNILQDNGNTGVNGSRTFTVDTAVPTQSAITDPVSGQNISGNYVITASATDGLTGIQNVSFYANGTLIGASLSSPYTYSWDTTLVGNGDYNLTVISSDYAGNTLTSSDVIITVDNEYPTLSLISPINLFYIPNTIYNFTFYPVDIVTGVKNCSLYTNKTGSWLVANSSSSISSGTDNILSTNFSSGENEFIWGVTCYDYAGNSNTSVNRTLFVDTVAPRIDNYSVNKSVLSAADNEVVNISVDISDLNISQVTITLHDNFNHLWTLYNNSVNSSELNWSINFQPNYSGSYYLTVSANDQVANSNNTEINNTIIFTVYNGEPSENVVSGSVSIFNKTFAQMKSYYDLPIPYYAGEPGQRQFSTNYTNLTTMPLYFNKPLFEGPDEMQNLVYNYSFEIDTSSLAAGSNVSINFTVPGAIPGFVRNETMATPQGNVTTVLMMPAMNETQGSQPQFLNRYSVYVNGVLYNTNESNNVTGTIGLDSRGQPLGWFALNLTGLSSSSNYSVSIPMAVAPTIRIDSQAISGFSPINPPTLGENITTTYIVNLTAINEYYVADNVSVLFIFPINATMNGVTKNISSNVSIQVWNGTDYVTAPTTNITNSSVISDSLFNQNITIYFTQYRVQLSNTSDLTSWDKDSTKKIRASAVLSFPALNESTPSGSAGSNEYKASVTMGTDAGLYIPTDKLPGITSASNVKVYVNGRELQTSNYVVGSIKINGTALNSGANDVKVTYDVASSSSSSSSGGGGGGSVVSNPSQSITYTLIQQGEEKQFDFTNEEIPVDEVVITAGETIENAKITAVSLGSEKPAVIPTAPPAKVYKYLQLDTSNINGKITTAKVKFRVEKTWFTDNNYDPSTTTLNRYHNEQWEHYTAMQVSEDDNYYYFEAEVPGFSYFAITADVLTVISPVQETGEQQATEQETTTPANNQQTEITPSIIDYNTLIVVFIAVVFLVSAAYVLMKKRP